MQAASASAPPTTLEISPASLAAAFATVPDPRRQASTAYPLGAILALAVAALRSAHTSVRAMAEWGRRQSPDLLAQRGFADGRTPCQSTLHRLFAKLDGAALAAVLGDYFATHLPAARADALQGVALDGKAQRGRDQYDGAPVHALTAFCHHHGVVLAQAPLASGGDKAEAELTMAPALVARLSWAGRVLTGDALFCQRHRCAQVVDAGGDYLLVARGNQPTLHAALQLLFDPPPDQAPLPLQDRREARTLEREHGRLAEVRPLVPTTDLTPCLHDDLGWPGLTPVFRRERRWTDHGCPTQQVLYGMTSLAPEQAGPATLRHLNRGHWEIDNRLHRVKDLVFGEDASLLHVGHDPAVLGLLRDATVSLLHRCGVRQITACVREFSQFPERAVALVIQAPLPHA